MSHLSAWQERISVDTDATGASGGVTAQALADGHAPGSRDARDLDYDLDEFTFRFDRRKSRNCGKLFYRLAQHAVAIDPVPDKSMVKCTPEAPRRTTTGKLQPESSK